MTPWQRYQADLQRPDFSYDPAQENAVKHLQALYDELLTEEKGDGPSSPLGRLFGRFRRSDPRPPVRGLYLWGGVGRGKTYLVDTFFEALPFAEKRRMHFHRFMQMAHEQLKNLRDTQNPLQLIGERFAAETRVLCFDEFFVTDIADAMILSGLLQALFDNGVTLVATSNIEPDGLYRDGLQRERFLPAIALIKQHTQVLNVDSGTDYRLRYLEQAKVYHSPLSVEVERLLEEQFDHVAGEHGERDTALEIEGRPIRVRRLSEGVAWFDFTALCDGPRSQADYIEIARLFHTVFVSDLPELTSDLDDQTRRFIALVDEFYDRGVNLICSAERPAEALYSGKRLAFAFERTVSRLQEMQSKDYLARPHKP